MSFCLVWVFEREEERQVVMGFKEGKGVNVA